MKRRLHAVLLSALLWGAGTPGAARADAVVMLQRANLRSGPSLRSAIVSSAERFEAFTLLRVGVDSRAGLWYQVDQDVRASYWRYAKFGETGWVFRERGFPADVFARPADGRGAIEMRERGVAKQRVKFTGREDGGWAEVSYVGLEDYLKNKAWVSSSVACRRPRWTVEDARLVVERLAASELPDEVKTWFVLGRKLDAVDEMEPQILQAPAEERVARARALLLADRVLRLGMTPEQVRLAWGAPDDEVRVEPAEAGEPGVEWTYANLAVRFDDGLVSEIYPGRR